MTAWVLIFCLLRSGCFAVDMYSKSDCIAARLAIDNADTITWCIRRK